MSELRTAWEALAAYEQADEDGVMVKVSRQAVDECLAAWNTRAPVRVKPLVWENWGRAKNTPPFVYKGVGALIYKVIQHADGSGGVYRFDYPQRPTRLASAPVKRVGEDGLKAAAQADYEARILSCIMGESE